jgi:mRNA interferase RelE/StbE
VIESAQRSREPVYLTRRGRAVDVVVDPGVFEKLVADAENALDRAELALARRAVRSLGLLERRDQQRIRAALDLLTENPRPPKCVALQGEDSVYRIRVGNHRIVI